MNQRLRRKLKTKVSLVILPYSKKRLPPIYTTTNPVGALLFGTFSEEVRDEIINKRIPVEKNILGDISILKPGIFLITKIYYTNKASQTEQQDTTEADSIWIDPTIEEDDLVGSLQKEILRDLNRIHEERNS